MKKVILDRELFLSKLGKTIKFIPSKTIIPAFDNAVINITENNAEIIASNGNTMVKVDCQVSSTEPFAFCVPAKLLYKTISLFNENKVTITLKTEDSIEVKCGKSKYKISLDCFPQDFPIMKVDGFHSEINMRQFDLKLGLDAAQKFVDENHQNANMTAVRVSEIDNKIVFTGLTQAIMCRAALSPISINKWESICVSKECASKVVSLLSEKGEVSITNNGNHISFFTDKDSLDGFEVISTSANIKFPDSEKLFSKKPENEVVINAMEFTGAVKRLELYASSAPAKVVIKSIDDNEISLTSTDNLLKRDGEEIVSAKNNSQHNIQKIFGIDDFLQILSHINSNDFTFLFSEQKNRPSFIIPKVNTENENIFSFLIADFIE